MVRLAIDNDEVILMQHVLHIKTNAGTLDVSGAALTYQQ